MNLIRKFTAFFILCLYLRVSAKEFTICSYNCGGLPEHYDYLRAASMQILMQERYSVQREEMFLNERIQRLWLKILFCSDENEKLLAEQEIELDRKISRASLQTEKELNIFWNTKLGQMITPYNVRPVLIRDKDVRQLVKQQLGYEAINSESLDSLSEIRRNMAKKIFADNLKYDIICLQEAGYLDESIFPEIYEVEFSKSKHKNGILWNKERFTKIKVIQSIKNRAFGIQLLDLKTGNKVIVASGHLTGCNPFYIEKNQDTGIADSSKGDRELKKLLRGLNNNEAELKLIGIDSNVTSLHPRLNLLKEAGYKIDYENHLDMTCTNPYHVLDTRIDWIALKSDVNEANITNISVSNVGLNNIETNFSDHKPIAATITFKKKPVFEFQCEETEQSGLEPDY